MKLKQCELILYQEDGYTLDSIKAICERYKSINEYAFCLQDKDIDKEGKLIKPHFHVDLHFTDSFDTDKLMSWFGCRNNQIQKIVGRYKDALLYLTHRNAPEKYQYPDSDVVSNFDYSKTIDVLSTNLKNEIKYTQLKALATDVMTGRKSYSQALKELPEYDYNEKAQRWLKDAFRIRCDTVVSDRMIDVIMIYGDAGVGKTTFAKMFCDAQHMEYYISSSDNDPMQDYKGQDVLILDDVREYSFELVDWLKLLDNNTGSSIRSRHFNKTFVGNTIIITTSWNPLYWFVSTGEQRWQFFRRISQYLTINKENVYQYEGFIQTPTNSIMLKPCIMTYKNPVLMLLQNKPPSNNVSSTIAVAMDVINNKMQEFALSGMVSVSVEQIKTEGL